MKTSRLLLLAGLLAGSVSFALAGPGPQFWIRPTAPKPAATAVVATAAATSQPAAIDAACTTCACCKKA